MKQIQLVRPQSGWTLHEGDPASLDRVRNDDFGTIGYAIERSKRVLNRMHIMTVTATDMPAKRTQLCLDVPEVADISHPGIRLDLVVIDDRDDLPEPHVGGRGE